MRISILALASLAISLPALAQEPQGGTLTLQFENDKIANTDRHYTNGVRVAWVSDRTKYESETMFDLLSWLYPIGDVHGGRLGFAAGQMLYTPSNTAAHELVPDDRPYAGWLYFSVAAMAETKGDVLDAELDALDTVELSLGVVGPLAGGRYVQNTVHEIIGVDTAEGWDNQLKNEPAVMLTAERKWRPQPGSLGPLSYDIIPNIGASVGNVMTLVNVGSTVRLGQGLHVDYGPPHIRPSLSGLDAVEPTGGRFAWYLFAGAEGRAVFHNIFLDGNTFSDSHSVDRNVFVGDLLGGAALVYDKYRLAFTQIYRTREFETQKSADIFGALSLSVHF